MKVDDALVEGITRIANTLLNKKHPDIKIQEWQTKYILEALILFMDALKRGGKE